MLADHETERQYLGAVLSDEGVLDRYPLSPGDLDNQRHALVLAAAQAVFARKAPLDFLTVIAELERSQDIRTAGGHDGVYASAKAPEAPIELIRQRLAELASMRRMRAAFMRATAACEELNAEQALSIAHQVVDESQLQRRRKILTVRELVRDAVAHLGLRADAPTRLVPTGMRAIDAQLGGLHGGELFTIGAQTNVGKSWTVLTCAMNIARQGFRAGIVSLEDPERLWGTRILASMARIDTRDMRSRQLTKEDFARIETATLAGAELGIELAIATGANVHEIVDTMRVLVRERGCHVLFLDYAQCLRGVKAQNDHSALREMYGLLKSAVERLDVPLILTSQIKRGDNPDREPSKYDLKEGGDLENKSEYVLMLWRDQQERHVVHGLLDKSKTGGNGTRVKFEQQPSGAFDEVEAPEVDMVREPRRSSLYDIRDRQRPRSRGEL
ncbi:MAG: hypothetical protein IT379_37255 [Deltaproteobacteria bacterium]|nr:hypothetical protein [Deltaproteobacteria bacterium]